MHFVTRKRRQPPAIIIISLIDILVVLLVFLVVTTTFKQQPSLRLALPESTQPKQSGSEESLVVTIARPSPERPNLYLGAVPVTMEKLQAELRARAAQNPKINLAIRADNDAPFGLIVKVMDAAKAAQIKSVSAFTRNPGQP